MSAERDPAPDCIHPFSSKKGHHYMKRTRSDNQTLASHLVCTVGCQMSPHGFPLSRDFPETFF